MEIDSIFIFNYVVLFIATYLITKRIVLRRFKNLPPSPLLSLPIIGHFYLLKRPFHHSLAKLAARHGPVLYLQLGSRPTLLLSFPSVVEECLIRTEAFVDRPLLIASKHQLFDCPAIPWAPYGAHWRNLRRIAAVEILSPQRLQILSGIRAHVARSFIRRMMKSSQDGPVEMKFALFGLTLDNMMRMLLGRSSYEEACNKEDMEGFQRYQEVVEESFRRNGISNIEDFFPILKWLRVSNEETVKKLKAERETFMRGLIEKHRKMEKEGTLTEAQHKSMLHVLLSFQSKDPQHYSDAIIGNLLLTLFQGGTDTSASTTVWSLSLLLNNPEVLKKAQDEIDKVVGYERLVEESDKNNLPYIQNIVNETFRMFPTGPLGLPYESRDDCQVAGYHVPRGTMLIYNIWAIHNDPKVWAEPRKFKPERFVGLSDKELGYEFMPFGAGKRICPGKHLASRVVWLAVAILVQCFEWERVGDMLVDMKEGCGLTLAKLEPLFAKCRPRPCMINVLSQL